MERRVKQILVSPEDVLHIFTMPQMTEFTYRFAQFEGLEGVKIEAVHFNANYNAFCLLLSREDWPEITMGHDVPRVEAPLVIVGVKLAVDEPE